MSKLTYVPPAQPARPFGKGDCVETLDREGAVMEVQTVTSVRARIVRTNCGRMWSTDGWWFDGEASWPFPSIRLKDVNNPALMG